MLFRRLGRGNLSDALLLRGGARLGLKGGPAAVGAGATVAALLWAELAWKVRGPATGRQIGRAREEVALLAETEPKDGPTMTLVDALRPGLSPRGRSGPLWKRHVNQPYQPLLVHYTYTALN